jgi:hypothetical protein
MKPERRVRNKFPVFFYRPKRFEKQPANSQAGGENGGIY